MSTALSTMTMPIMSARHLGEALHHWKNAGIPAPASNDPGKITGR
ncbi:hypothetical protein [Aliihoeflea sp. 40Bstr573]|nr:hypothetical protein [Aliihoeflea sp. 40Bstr573]